MEDSNEIQSSQAFFVEVSPSSPLSFSSLRQYQGVTFWDRSEIPDIPFSDGDFQIPLQSTDRLDNLAYSFYKDPDLFWVLAYANGVYLPPLQLNGGYNLRVPPAAALARIFRKSE